MDIENLKTFCIVANHKSFIKAAEFLNVTQSGISRRIQSLENELGVSLFIRTPQSVTLTKVGKSFLPYAERSVQIFQEGQKKIVNENNEEKLVIGAPQAVCIHLLPKVIQEFLQEHRVHVSVNAAHSQHVFDMLIDRTIDVGFTTVPFPSSLLNYEHVYMEDVICVGHPELIKQYIDDNVIIKHPVPIILINLRNINIYPWDSINQYFMNNPLFEIIVDAGLEVADHLARMGVGLTILPVSAAEEGIKRGELAEVSLPEANIPSRPVYMATYKNIQMENAIQQFQNTVKRVLTKGSLL